MSEFHKYDPLFYQKVADGDEAAFRELFELYVPRLQAMVMRITGSASVADDLVQEAFLKIWVARDQLPTLQQPGVWIMKIGFYLAVNHMRRKQRHHQALHEIGYRQEISMHLLTGNEQADFRQLLQLVTNAVQELPDKQREIYRMTREKGMTISEIAGEMGLAVSTVKNLLVMALKTIRKSIQQGGHLCLLIKFLHLL